MLKRLTFAGFVLFALLLVTVLAQSGLPEEVSGYLQWSRANPQKSFEESAHPVAKDIYYNETAGPTILSQNFPYPEGSILVKERTDPESLMVTTLYAMRKAPGFDPDNGDWQYGVFEQMDDGSFGNGWFTAENQAMCVGCHSDAADKDYTFLSYLP